MIRRIAPALVCAVALSALPSRAVEVSKNAFVLVPVIRPNGSTSASLLLYGLEWEHATGPTGFDLAPAVNDFRGVPVQVSLDMGVRFYPFSKAPGGFFVGPNIGVAYRDYNEVAGYGYTGGFQVGAEAGFSLVMGWFDLSIAGGYEFFRNYWATTAPFQFLPDGPGDLRAFGRAGVGVVF